MTQKSRANENGLTILELIVIIIILVVIGHVAIVTLAQSFGSPSEGMVGAFAGESGYSVRHIGSITGFSAVNGNHSDVMVQYLKQDAANLGAVQMTVSLLIGDMGGVDFDKVNLYVVNSDGAETIPRKTVQPLICPGWMITNRFNVPQPAPLTAGKLPGNIPAAKKGGNRSAVSSLSGADILYPGEVFELMICPTNTTPPYQQITISVNPPGSTQPPVAVISVPPDVQPVMTLGSE
ncbi:hypothetical protein [uncultured Methanoregula sp.]|uniref:hypothetical protein n=1 Tax=uncultured Methanoregula sp. TaxID=1005933 RepID=UPI002AAB1DA8|nr:hypothetical protein [uncultured Methanoregula sp.]